ncbi:MAG: IclR family transcriptional regulator C-terminal domain-containing protein [Pseudomonadota bacterium]
MAGGIETSQSLARGLQVLELLSEHPAGLTLSDVAKRLDLARAGARRALHTLHLAGYARQSGRYFLPTGRPVRMAGPARPDSDWWRRALPSMRAVSEDTGEACSLSILDGRDIVYVARSPGTRVLSVQLDVGAHLPALYTSMGRVLLADLDPLWLDDLLRNVPAPPSPRAAPDRAALLSAIAGVRGAGHAVVDQELEEGLISAAVPVRLPNGPCLAALNLSSMPMRHSPDCMRDRIVPRLHAAAATVARALTQTP